MKSFQFYGKLFGNRLNFICGFQLKAINCFDCRVYSQINYINLIDEGRLIKLDKADILEDEIKQTQTFTYKIG